MLPLFLPFQRRLDPAADTVRLSVFTKLPGPIAVAALAPVDPNSGRVTVDGAPLARREVVPLRGLWLLFLPLGDVAHDCDRRHRVVLEGFRTPSGRRFPRCAFTVRTAPRRDPDPRFAESDARTLQAALEGMVLLRNENAALPLAPGAALNCFGAAQHFWRVSAAGASRIRPRWCPGFHRAAAEHSSFAVNDELSDFYRAPGAVLPPEDLLERARRRSDAALVFVGRQSGEMLDNRPAPGDYYLSDDELTLLRLVRARFPKVVVILNTGGPIGMNWLKDIPVDAILFTGFAGSMSAWALMELLDGRASPSGRLPDTWPWDFADDPVSRNYPVADPDGPFVHEDESGARVYYEEDVYLGYRYFDTFGVPVAFPFGHGLGYARFALSPLSLDRAGDTVSVRVAVRNEGPIPGKCVVQLYAAPPRGRLERPARLLAGFGKTALLAPGEGETLVLTARLADITAFDEARSAYVLEAGEYAFLVGEGPASLVPCGGFRSDHRVLKTVHAYAAPTEPFKRLTRADPTVDGTRSKLVPLGAQIAAPAVRVPYAPPPLPKRAGPRLRWRDVEADPSKLAAFVSGLTLLELCRLNVCAGARWLPWQDGMAGHTPRLGRVGLPAFNASDANAGLNLAAPNVGMPASSVVAATFNREIACDVGRAVAAECPAHGVDLVLAPGMNLHRGALCGRNPEYFSEDPLLAGELAGWHARGLEEGGVGSCCKHLFCNNAELARLGGHSVVSRQALRELYLRAFEIAFRVQRPSAVMTSYNALNGLYPGENAALLQGLLRGEWGFDGAVMSDWSSTRTVSAVEMVKAGNCWITPGGPRWLWRVWRAARRGDIPRATLEHNVLHLLKGFGRN